MKRYLAILLMLVYTAFSVVAIAQSRHYCNNGNCTKESPLSDTNTPKECNEHELAGRHEAHGIAGPISFQKRLVSQPYTGNNTKTYFASSKTLYRPHSDATRAASPVPVYIRHCAFIL